MMKILAMRMANHSLFPYPFPYTQQKRIPGWAERQIIVLQLDSLTNMLIDWFCFETIDIYESPIN